MQLMYSIRRYVLFACHVTSVIPCHSSWNIYSWHFSDTCRSAPCKVVNVIIVFLHILIKFNVYTCAKKWAANLMWFYLYGGVICNNLHRITIGLMVLPAILGSFPEISFPNTRLLLLFITRLLFVFVVNYRRE